MTTNKSKEINFHEQRLKKYLYSNDGDTKLINLVKIANKYLLLKAMSENNHLKHAIKICSEMKDVKENKDSLEMVKSLICSLAVANQRDNGTYLDYITSMYELDYINMSRAKSIGQFFTPSDVAKVLAKINVSLNSADKFEDNLVKVGEPCCGTGVMLLETVNAVQEQIREKCLNLDIVAYAEDIDTKALHMFVFNYLMSIVFNNAKPVKEIYIENRNTITREGYPFFEMVVAQRQPGEGLFSHPSYLKLKERFNDKQEATV